MKVHQLRFFKVIAVSIYQHSCGNRTVNRLENRKIEQLKTKFLRSTARFIWIFKEIQRYGPI
jgi:hypothetical protein